MHVGKFWKTEPRLRTWMGGRFWPQWIAEEYDWQNVFFTSDGSTPPVVPIDGVVLQTIDETGGTFTYYKTFIWSGHDVTLGFTGKLVTSNTRIEVAPILELDGTTELAAQIFGASSADWSQVQGNPIAYTPKTGWLLRTGPGIGFQAVRW